MAAIRQFSCPSCGAGLRVGTALAPGKKIKCPKCAIVFPRPADDEDEAPAARVTAARPRKAVVPPAREEEDEVPASTKSRKKPREAAGKTPLVLVGVAVLVIAVGVTCALVFWPRKKDTAQAAGGGSSPQVPFGPQGPFGPGGPGGGPGRASPIRQIMRKVASGPQSLTQVVGRELKEDSPPWDKIQPQAREFVQLTQELAGAEPPRGSKESWAKLTAAYAKSAADLDKAATASDRNAALAAHDQLANSCTVCHREHRPMGPRGMRPGGMRPGAPGFPPGNPGQQ